MTTIIIGPQVFDFLFYLIVFCAGLDLTWSGYRIIKDKTHKLMKPKLLGYWAAQIYQTRASNNNSVFATKYFSFWNKYAGISLFTGGILITCGCVIMAVDFLLRR
jgi:hypothetical protein